MGDVVSLIEQRDRARSSQETRKRVLAMLAGLADLEFHVADLALDEVRRRVYWWSLVGTEYPVPALPHMREAIGRTVPLFADVPFRACLDTFEVARCTLWARAVGVDGQPGPGPDEVVVWRE